MASEFFEQIEEDLNPAQLEAVLEHNKPTLVLSGAGTGKTRVITYKIAYLIAELGIKPNKIIAMTFTNKAAEEMRNRAYTLISSATQEEVFSRNLWIGTFHSNCARILRFHGKYLGYTSAFTIIDEDDKGKLLNEIIKEKNFKHLTKLSKAKGDISKAKNNFLDAEDIITIGKDANEKYYSELSILYEEYNKRLHKSNSMDFDDLIVNTVKLFYQDEEIRKYWQDAFEYVLVDEFQDTNKSQYLLLKLLMKQDGKNLTMVGDDDQSIYSFRGAAIENILTLPNDFPDLKMIKVIENYRSVPEILHIANEVIANNKNRLGKNLIPKIGSKNRIPVVYFAEDDRDESAFIARKIKDFYQDYPEYKIAVIYRMNAQSRIFENAMTENRIPYTILGTKSFYDRREIKDLIAYFRIICNPKDNIAFKRIINIPHRGIGETTLAKIESLASEKGFSLSETLQLITKDKPELNIRPGIVTALKDFQILIDELREISANEPEKLLSLLLDATDYIKFLDSYGDEEDRKANIEELKRYYDSFFAEEKDPSFEKFLQNLILMDHSEEQDEEKQGKRVFLSTVHSCKGLEFDIVFVAGLAEEIFPHHMSVSTEEELEEERRLFYVSVTRAKNELFLSYPKRMFRNGTQEFFYQSRFIREIPENAAHFQNKPDLKNLKNLKSFF